MKMSSGSCGKGITPYSRLKLAPGIIVALAAVLLLSLSGQGQTSPETERIVPWRVAPGARIPAPNFAAPWLTFNTGLTAAAGSPIALATGDADGDGDIDVVAARAYAEGGFVYLRNEIAGRLAQPVSYAGTGKSSGIAMADLDGDGDLDVAVTDSDALVTGNTVSVYLGNGDGTFGTRQPVSVGTGAKVPVGIATADFDEDGDVDLAVAAYGYVGGGNTVVLLWNNGNGTFGAPIAFTTSSNPYDIAVGDLTGDGRPDLVVGHVDYAVSLLVNNGAGGFAPSVIYRNLGGIYAGPLFPCVAIADADKDGDLDVFYGNTRTYDGYLTGYVIQLRNNGTGNLSRGANVPLGFYSAGPTDIVASDLNGDGAPDLMAASYSGRTADGVFVLLNDGTGGYGLPVLYSGGQATNALAVADLNGDLSPDILMTDSYTNAVAVHFNPGTGVFPALTDDFLAFSQVFQDAADIDGDGDLDLFTSGPHPIASGGTIVRNDGTGHFFPPTNIYNGNDGISAGVLRDLNGDGKPDLLFNNANTASQYDFFTAMNTGDGTFGAITRWVVKSAGWGAIEAFDLDNDGDLDVVDMESLGAPSIPPGRFFIALNNGDGTFQTPTHYDLLPGRPDGVVAGDFNEDGKLDLAMTNQGAYGFDSRAFIVLGRGDGTFDPPIVYTVGRGPLYLVVANLDRDTHLDLATQNSGYNGEGEEGITVLFGTGTGTFTRLRTYYAPNSPDLLGATGLEAGDVDGDGDVDLMATGVSNDIALYLNDGRGRFTFPYRLGAVRGAHWPIFADFTGDGLKDIALLSVQLPVGADSGMAVLPGIPRR